MTSSLWMARKGAEDACVAVIRKGGSMSIRQALLPDVVQFSSEEVLKFPTRAAFIREPIDRFKSAFSFFTHMYNRMKEKDSVTGDDIPPIDIVKAGWRSWVDWALSNPNDHWNLQSEQIMHEGQVVPNELHRFENIHAHWERLFGAGMLPHINGATRVATDSYRENDLIEYYQADLDLWHSL